MLRFKDFILLETIDNLFIADKEKREKYVDQVWDILQHSYKKIGGIHGAGFNSKEEMINTLPLWKIYRQGDTVKAVLMYKSKNGRKSVASGTDGESDTKKFFAKMKADEMSTGRSYGEVSDNALFFLIKTRKAKILDDIVPYEEAVKRAEANGDKVEPKSIKAEKRFVDEVVEYFNGKDAHKLGLSREEMHAIVKSLTAACYRRKIGDHYHTKVMVGNIDAPDVIKKRQ